MGFVYAFGVCLFCLSVWAVVQLTLMAFFFSIEASTLIHELEPKKHKDAIDFLVKAKANYQKAASNCYYAAYAYTLLMVLSWFIIFQGKIMDRQRALKLLGEDCTYSLS